MSWRTFDFVLGHPCRTVHFRICMVLSFFVSLCISFWPGCDIGRKSAMWICSNYFSMIRTSASSSLTLLVFFRHALDSVSARYMCLPGLKQMSRSYFCSRRNILCKRLGAETSFSFTVDPLWFSHQETSYGLIQGAQEVFRSRWNLKGHLEPTIQTKGRAKWR